MPSRAYGPPRDLGPGDLGLRELADEEAREDRAERDADVDLALLWAETDADFLD